MGQQNYVAIDYTNWRGERAHRTILPRLFAFHTHNSFHGRGWILEAWDVRKQEWREFAMASIHSWLEMEQDPFDVIDSKPHDSATTESVGTGDH